MVHEVLVIFIRKAFLLGYPFDYIFGKLIEKGWSEEEVTEAVEIVKKESKKENFFVKTSNSSFLPPLKEDNRKKKIVGILLWFVIFFLILIGALLFFNGFLKSDSDSKTFKLSKGGCFLKGNFNYDSLNLGEKVKLFVFNFEDKNLISWRVVNSSVGALENNLGSEVNFVALKSGITEIIAFDNSFGEDCFFSFKVQVF